MIITATALNQLENKFTPNGFGVEIITPSTLTYNKVNTAVNNGLMPVLKEEANGNTYLSALEKCNFNGTTYYVLFDTSYTSTNANAIMTIVQTV